MDGARHAARCEGRAGADPHHPTALPGRRAFFVENRLTDSGATGANALVKAWQARAARSWRKSKAVPIKHIVASPNLSAADIEKVRDYLVGLDTHDDGKKKLEPTGTAASRSSTKRRCWRSAPGWACEPRPAGSGQQLTEAVAISSSNKAIDTRPESA